MMVGTTLGACPRKRDAPFIEDSPHIVNDPESHYAFPFFAELEEVGSFDENRFHLEERASIFELNGLGIIRDGWIQRVFHVRAVGDGTINPGFPKSNWMPVSAPVAGDVKSAKVYLSVLPIAARLFPFFESCKTLIES
jgi:hypothetical protein